MRYATGGAFRQALEDRLRAENLATGAPLVRLRKMVAFERFLARLIADRPGDWLLKGGLELQWRLGGRARTTRDLDMLLLGSAEDIHANLVRAALLDLGDWLGYQVARPSRQRDEAAGGLRYAVRATLDGRPFEGFHVDVGWGDPVVEPPENVTAPSLLGFAEIAPIVMPCYPVTQHLAEKLHAYSRPYASGESSRAKDLVDMILLGELQPVAAGPLSEAVRATFQRRNTHAMPDRLSEPPSSWAAPFRRMAAEVGLDSRHLDEGIERARCFLDPLLQGQAQGVWDPVAWRWSG